MVVPLIAERVKEGSVVALGDGEISEKLIKHLALTEKKVKVFPTSIKVAEVAAEFGMPLVSSSEDIDLAVMYASSVNEDMDFLLASSQSLIRDKIIADWARELVVVAEDMGDLGGKVLVEASRFYLSKTLIHLETFGSVETVSPSLSGNIILSVDIEGIDDPEGMDIALKKIPGVVETGIFYDVAEIVILEKEGKVIANRRSPAEQKVAPL